MALPTRWNCWLAAHDRAPAILDAAPGRAKRAKRHPPAIPVARACMQHALAKGGADARKPLLPLLWGRAGAKTSRPRLRRAGCGPRPAPRAPRCDRHSPTPAIQELPTPPRARLFGRQWMTRPAGSGSPARRTRARAAPRGGTTIARDPAAEGPLLASAARSALKRSSTYLKTGIRRRRRHIVASIALTRSQL